MIGLSPANTGLVAKCQGYLSYVSSPLHPSEEQALKLCPECFTEFDDAASECPTDGIPLSLVEADPLVGTKISDRYEILSIIGRGGMGVVYKGRHDSMDRLVAIKMLHAHLVSDAEALKRFHREAKAVSRVKHPHTVTLYDFGISATGQPYIVMDFIEGTSLKAILKENGPLSLDRLNHIFQQVIEALSTAHAEGIVHRDLKPENIMLTKRANDPDWVQVVDFGISKLKSRENNQTYNITKVGDVCGSPPYMSPEQCVASMPIDSRSDIYSLAVVLYESLSGRLPFKAKTAIEMIDSHLYATPAPLKAAHPELACCDSLSALINKALSKEPEKRQQTMEELGRDLHDAIRRDIIKLNSYRRRANDQLAVAAMEMEAQAAAAAPALRDPQKLTAERLASLSPSGGNASSDSVVARLMGGVASIFGKKHGNAEVGSNTYLTQCPFCNAAVEPKIRFCLDCGRNLSSPEELTKLRQLQGVFSLPRTASLESQTPEFSRKAKKTLSSPRTIFGLPPALLAFNLVLIIALAVLYFAQDAGVKSQKAAQKQTTKKSNKLISSSSSKTKKRSQR